MNWKSEQNIIAIGLLCLLSPALAGRLFPVAQADEPLPNVLIITADNLGYGDLQMYNPDSRIPTPHLDQLAAGGARLTDFYTASPTCTVSRACLLTGRIPQRHGLTDQLAGVKGNYGTGLHQREILIPQVLKRAPVPYATGCFGKWNIGFAEGSRPTERGFDEFVGHASGNLDYFHHNYRERHDLYDGIAELHREGEYSTNIFADAAADFITRRSAERNPWFCYVPFNAPHFPTAGNKKPGQPNIWQAPAGAFQACGLSPDEEDPHKRYIAVVYALDAGIGKVLAALDTAGVADNTFVFFMSDNGAFRLNRRGLDVGDNSPLRHGGVTCWEGGLRVPAIARWPGKIPAATEVDTPLWSPDLFVAAATLANAVLPQQVRVDGRNPLPSLTAGAASPHTSLYFQYRTHAALRSGHWKIVREKPDHPWQLFDLANDVGELSDVSKKNAGQLSQLAQEFDAWEQSFQRQK